MSSRSLNKVQLIGNLTRDPELRYTPTGAAVCTIGLATNRSWVTDSGERKEETEFHRVIAWNKLAELCSQLLSKGRKVFVEGRLRTNNWQGQDGSQHSVTEIVIEDMIILDSKRVGTDEAGSAPHETQAEGGEHQTEKPENDSPKVEASEKTVVEQPAPQENVNPDDIPF